MHYDGSVVSLNALSSGEQILVALVLCLYHIRENSSFADTPALLLLDEIDAPLHPGMVQALLNLVERDFVQKHGIKVILATHAPSTVALVTSEDAVHVMHRERRRIERASRDAALRALTVGVPTLSIARQHRRQILVESTHDEGYYERIADLLKKQLPPEISVPLSRAGRNMTVAVIEYGSWWTVSRKQEMDRSLV